MMILRFQQNEYSNTILYITFVVMSGFVYFLLNSDPDFVKHMYVYFFYVIGQATQNLKCQTHSNSNSVKRFMHQSSTIF